MPLITQAKKLVLISTIFSSITEVSIRVENQQLEYVLSILYLVKFKKDKIEIRALIDFSSEVNAITSAYAALQRLRACSIDIGAQKIDGSTLSTHYIVLTNFYLKDK